MKTADLDRALEVAQNTGGWSFEEAALMAEVLTFLADNAQITVELDDRVLIVARLRNVVPDGGKHEVFPRLDMSVH